MWQSVDQQAGRPPARGRCVQCLYEFGAEGAVIIYPYTSYAFEQPSRRLVRPLDPAFGVDGEQRRWRSVDERVRKAIVRDALGVQRAQRLDGTIERAAQLVETAAPTRWW